MVVCGILEQKRVPIECSALPIWLQHLGEGINTSLRFLVQYKKWQAAMKPKLQAENLLADETRLCI